MEEREAGGLAVPVRDQAAILGLRAKAIADEAFFRRDDRMGSRSYSASPRMKRSINEASAGVAGRMESMI